MGKIVGSAAEIRYIYVCIRIVLYVLCTDYFHRGNIIMYCMGMYCTSIVHQQNFTYIKSIKSTCTNSLIFDTPYSVLYGYIQDDKGFFIIFVSHHFL